MQFNTLHSNIPWTKSSTLLYDIWCAKQMLNNTGIRWRHHSSPLSELCALERKIRRVGASMLIGPRAGCLQWERLYGWGCFHAHRTHYGPRSQVLFRAWTALGLRYAAGMYLQGWEHWESDVSLCQWWRQHRGLKQDVENAWQVLTVRDSLHYSILAVSEQKISSECSVTWKKGNVTSLCVFRVSPQFELISGALVIDFVCHVI